jgi:hypothetical protein
VLFICTKTLLATFKSKQDLKFEQPDLIRVETYKYEWLRTNLTILNQLLLHFEKVCNSKWCPRMIVGLDLEFLCIVYSSKTGKQCYPMYCCTHNLETIQNLLNDHSYFYNRSDVKERRVLAFSQMFKDFHRIITPTYYNHKDVFIK